MCSISFVLWLSVPKKPGAQPNTAARFSSIRSRSVLESCKESQMFEGACIFSLSFTCVHVRAHVRAQSFVLALAYIFILVFKVTDNFWLTIFTRLHQKCNKFTHIFITSKILPTTQDKQRKQRHPLKLGKKRRESSKRNYYIIFPRVIIKAIIIIPFSPT